MTDVVQFSLVKWNDSLPSPLPFATSCRSALCDGRKGEIPITFHLTFTVAKNIITTSLQNKQHPSFSNAMLFENSGFQQAMKRVSFDELKYVVLSLLSWENSSDEEQNVLKKSKSSPVVAGWKVLLVKWTASTEAINSATLISWLTLACLTPFITLQRAEQNAFTRVLSLSICVSGHTKESFTI